MNPPRILAALSLALALFGLAVPATAHDGHDHGDAAPVAAGPGLPRVVAVSELFELVGVLDGRQLTLYLDRFADNEPVRDARIELDIAGSRFTAEPKAGPMAASGAAVPADAEYVVMLAAAPLAGVLPVTATVSAGADTDLLVGELDVHDDARAQAAAGGRAWIATVAWAAGGLAGVAALAAIAWRLVSARRVRGAGAA